MSQDTLVNWLCLPRFSHCYTGEIAWMSLVLVYNYDYHI